MSRHRAMPPPRARPYRRLSVSAFSHIAMAGVGASSLLSRDWSAFAPPYRGWDRSIARMEAHADRRIDAAVRDARDSGQLAALPEPWVQFLRVHLQVGAFFSKAVARVLTHATEQCPWPAIGGCLHMSALTHERQAVSIVLLATDLEAVTGSSPIEEARARWLADPSWQGAREVLARLEATGDWAEALVVVHLCLEPLAGVLLRREFGTTAARAYADPVTPAIAEAGQLEYEWACDWTSALVRFLLDDPEHGSANRAVVRSWLDRWTPQVRSATERVADLGGQLAPVRTSASLLASVGDEQQRVLTAAGLA